MTKNKCKVCGHVFSAGHGFFVYDTAEEYFLCDVCARTARPATREDGIERCELCGDGVIENGVCNKCGV
jgi:ribosomal protein L32